MSGGGAQRDQLGAVAAASRGLQEDAAFGFEVTANARYTLSRGDVIWAWGQNSQPQPGRGKFIPRPAFPSASVALSKWKALTSPKMIKRDPLNIPAGV